MSIRNCLVCVLLFLASVLGMSVSAGAQELRWQRVARTAADDASRLRRPILVYIGARDCQYCRVMERETWRNQRIVSRVAQNFVPLKVVAEDNQKLVEAFQVSVYPTTLLYTSDRKLISRLEGYFPPEALAESLNKAQPAGAPASATKVPSNAVIR